MVTSRDVARAAGVSQATVSRVLTGGSVSTETRRRVEQAVAALRYAPHAGARAMRSGQTGAVGVVVADVENPFYPRLLQSLAQTLDDAGYRMIVWIAHEHGNRAALEAIEQRTVDGIVFTTATEASPELREALARWHPLVLVNRTLDDVDCDQVSSDNIGGARLIAGYFVLNGRTRPAFLGGNPRAMTSRERQRGFAAELAALGRPLNPALLVEGEYTYAAGYAGSGALLDIEPRLDALFCANDLLAFGAIDSLRDRGVRVPEDVWVVGYDDIPMAAWSSFSLTTVRQEVDLIAAKSVALLRARIADGSRARTTERIPAVLVPRRSTASVAVGV